MSTLKVLRETLHMFPEPGMEEHRTREELLRFVESLPLKKIERLDAPDTGLIFVYHNSDTPFVLLRADMDGLPLEEETGVSYCSRIPGWMHACGHDVHMTVLAGVIARVVELQPCLNAIFLFQPAEEGPGGAEPILRSGVLEDFDIGSALALHVNPDYSVGTIASTAGAIFGNATEFDVIFEGKEAHGAFPHRGRDAILPASDFVKTSYEMLSRVVAEEDRFVYTIGKLIAGSRRNIVAGRAVVEGTFRALSEKTKRLIMDTIEKLSERLGSVWDVDFRVEYGAMYPEVDNDSAVVKEIQNTVTELGYNYIACGTTFTGEDFGFFAQRYPAGLFWLGCSNEDMKENLHTPRFLPDHGCIEIGVETMYRLLARFS